MKRVIFNADDFGMTEGINSGILDCHARGPVTSTSLLVRAPATGDAVDRAGDHPELAREYFDAEKVLRSLLGRAGL